MGLVLFKRAIDSQPYIQCTLKESDYITIKQILKQPVYFSVYKHELADYTGIFHPNESFHYVWLSLVSYTS